MHSDLQVFSEPLTVKQMAKTGLLASIQAELRRFFSITGAALIETGSELYEQYGPWLRSWTARGAVLMFIANIIPALGFSPTDGALQMLATRLYLMLNALGFLAVIIGRGHAKGPLFGNLSPFPIEHAAPGVSGMLRADRLAALAQSIDAGAPSFDLVKHLGRANEPPPSDPLPVKPPSDAPAGTPARVPEPVAARPAPSSPTKRRAATKARKPAAKGRAPAKKAAKRRQAA